MNRFVKKEVIPLIRDFQEKVKTREHVWIPMADGVRLAAKTWMTEDAGQSPVPAILEYIPYRKRDLTAWRDAFTHPYLAGHGYACLRVDLRGSGDSEGVLTDEYLQLELDDGLRVLRWIAGQPWCNGRVGMMGLSWGGFNSLQVAVLQPPELRAIITPCSTDGRYADDVHYMGGCLLGDNLSWASAMLAHTSLPPDPLIVGARWRRMWHPQLEESGLWLTTWLNHQRRDEYWKHGSICEDFSRMKCPVYAISGWADGYSNAVFRLLGHLDVPRKGLVGPWGHKYPHLGSPGPAIGFLQEALRWWDHWLKGIDTGIMNEPMLRVWMQDSVPPVTNYATRPGRWVAESTWPSPHIRNDCHTLLHGRLEKGGAKGAKDRQTILDPERRYRIRVRLNDIAQMFPRGHRLGLSLSTSYWPLAWPPPEPVRLEIFSGSGRLCLPERKFSAIDRKLTPFPDPEGARTLPTTSIIPRQYSWRVIRDLAENVSTLEVIKDEGTYRLEKTKLDIRSKTVEKYTYWNDDFTSVRGETLCERGVQREGWAAKTVMNTVLTSTKTHFRVQADIDAFEDTRRVYANSWHLKILRDFI